jgi:type VI secretion system protein ImpA
MPLRGDLLTPIPGENPSGANLRYDPVTDEIKEARREDDLNLAQGEWAAALKIADYPAVIEMGSEALARRGKDLQIAVWLVDAHIRREGFSAVAPCFHFLHDLLEQFWDTLYPPIDEDGDRCSCHRRFKRTRSPTTSGGSCSTNIKNDARLTHPESRGVNGSLRRVR